jgi:DNA invertase Pin-like site-specific DNA recombinase
MRKTKPAIASRLKQDGAPRFRAAMYLRVSTTKQADKDIDPEGYSLPSQRQSGLRKAEDLGAEVVEVYIDRGESAKTSERPAFLRMLRRIQEQRDIDYVIVDKIDRFARNRRDDANVLFDLRSAGCKLVSVKENIDETPAGGLMHGILATFAEYESRNNGTRTISGMTLKAQVGGTPGRAPIGYRNVGRWIDDHEVRWVEIDPERAPHVQWAFEAYASGEWTMTNLTEALRARGFRSLPNGKGTPAPISRSTVANMLSNRYYLGYVSFMGVEYKGRHQPLVPESIFERVDDVTKLHDRAGEKRRIHNHYLKGTIYCAYCGNRLGFTRAKGVYDYFYCIGRQMKRAECPQRHYRIEEIEEAVEQLYLSRVRLTADQCTDIREGIRIELEQQRHQAGPEIAWAERRVSELEVERRRLARAIVEGTIPGDLVREEQERIKTELKDAARLLKASRAVFSKIEAPLLLALKLLEDPNGLYSRLGPRGRRLLNQFFFEKVLIEQNRAAETVLKDPWRTILDPVFGSEMQSIRKAGAGSARSKGRKSRNVHPTTPPSNGVCSKVKSLAPPAVSDSRT